MLCLVEEKKESKMNLFEAAEAGNLERVQELVGSGVDKDEVDSRKRTALWIVCMEGHFPIVQFLKEQGGADMEKTNHFGESCLLIASARNHIDVVRYLLEQGADREKGGYGDNTALHGDSLSHTPLVHPLLHPLNKSLIHNTLIYPLVPKLLLVMVISR